MCRYGLVFLLRSLAYIHFTGFRIRLQVMLASEADTAVSKYISHDWTLSVWSTPTLCDVLSFNLPVAVFYADQDVLIPPHQGVVLSRVSQGRIPCYIFQGATNVDILFICDSKAGR